MIKTVAVSDAKKAVNFILSDDLTSVRHERLQKREWLNPMKAFYELRKNSSTMARGSACPGAELRQAGAL